MSLVTAAIQISRIVQYIAVALIGLVAFIALGLTIAAAFGAFPWLSLPLTFGDVTYPQAGMYVQIALTGLLCAMAFMIPTNARVMKLEQSHRRFQLTMDDVARAYHLCHTADRAGVFTMSSEFDAVRERLAYLRDHPDLAQLEPGVLEVAAQMSQQSRHLADVYSDEKVARAKKFLTERQEEAERQQELIVEALHACTEIRKWAEQVELEESVVASQLQQLDEKLQAALPTLGYTLEHEDEDREKPQNVVSMPQKPAAE
ncbi:MAG: DNA repair protein [Paracoccaceae bacterium]